MAWVQYFPKTPVVSLGNATSSGWAKLIPGAVEHVRYPARNLLTTARSEKWRAPITSSSQQVFVGFDFGSVQQFQVVGLIDLRLVYCNQFTPIEQQAEQKEIKFWLCGADNAAFTTNYWEIELWAYSLVIDPIRGTLTQAGMRTMYLNLDDNGTLL